MELDFLLTTYLDEINMNWIYVKFLDTIFRTV